MKQIYRVRFTTPQFFKAKELNIEMAVVDGTEDGAIELLLHAQAKHQIGTRFGRPPDQVQILACTLI